MSRGREEFAPGQLPGGGQRVIRDVPVGDAHAAVAELLGEDAVVMLDALDPALDLNVPIEAVSVARWIPWNGEWHADERGAWVGWRAGEVGLGAVLLYGPFDSSVAVLNPVTGRRRRRVVRAIAWVTGLDGTSTWREGLWLRHNPWF